MIRSRRWALAAVAPAAVVLALALPAAGASAAAGEESITAYDIELTVRPDASMHVQETIRYDFADSPDRHGIIRVIPVEFAYDDTHSRVYPVTNVQVFSTDASPELHSDFGSVVTLKIGDANTTVTGVKTYRISYDVGGAVNTLPDGQELYWNVIGGEWEHPITGAKVTLEGPAAVLRTACFEGRQGSTQECGHTLDAGKAVFTAAALAPGQGMTIVAGFAPGTFPSAHPILAQTWSLQRAFALTPITGVASVGILAALVAAIGALVSRRGRDQRYLDVIPGLAPAPGQDERVSPVAVFRRDPVAVQFTPPADLRPGELGTLIDERANVVDVTATIVDLAVRGYLRIEEVDEPRRFHSGDWRLTTVQPAPTDPLLDYEQALFNAIFDGRDSVLLSELRQTFRSDLTRVQSMLYEDVTQRGWFRGNPSSVRIRWQVFGVLLTLIGVGLTWLLAARTSFGLPGVAVVVAGVVLLALAGHMPARTAQGTALLAQAKGFRTYLETAEANQIRFEEGQDVFSRYLPYAIVFGVAERWAKVFADLAASGAQVAVPSWYVGGYAAGMFDYSGFGRSMDSFTTTTAGSIAAATPSSSGSSGFGGGGFAGGGGGGGGGGSW